MDWRRRQHAGPRSFVLRTAGLAVERDLHFAADKPLCAYADVTRLAGRIIA
ncbi:DUF2958 domain-containing protein [Vitreimonas flagellata]|uniref:DUF2958 domain-containing protein n=1 Tax=Vitreimonas flagellata TaxID=2560861 RepID=UPI001EF9B051|nr:DUF2958 domain-containing protein [Vitreimonas flagellata]